MTTYTDIELMEGAAYTWRFSLRDEHDTVLPLDNFLIYGGAACPGQVTRDFVVTIEDGEAVAVMPGLPATRNAWQYQLFAQEKSSRVEWLISAGSAIITPRTSGAREVYDPTLNTFTAVLDKSTISHTLKVGDNMASISRNTATAIQRATEATAAANTATEKATTATTAAGTATTQAGIATTAAGTATEKATAATTAANTATEKATAATTAAKTATEKATAATTAANTATEKATTATTAAKTATEKATAATTAANTATEKATTATTAAKTATEKATAATTAANTATEKATAASTSADLAKQSEESARQAEENAQNAASGIAAHLENTGIHFSPQEKKELHRLSQMYPGVAPDTPTVPGMPASAVSNDWMAGYFSRNAQPGHTEAPIAVYVSRVPNARWDGTAWLNASPAVDEAAYHTTRKFMDNAGLVHSVSTHTTENRDDYNGKLWPFFWANGNYEVDELGVKYVTAVEGQQIKRTPDSAPVEFDKTKNTCVFGPAFYFFCKLERYYDEETGLWSTHDGTEDGEPLFQLYGLSAQSWEELDEGRREELERHGITAEDWHLWPECEVWDASADNGAGAWVKRPYWCHAKYCGGYERPADGPAVMVSKENAPLYGDLSYHKFLSLFGYSPGMGGSAAVNGFGLLFSVVKNATKNSQSVYYGVTSNYTNAVLATYSTKEPGYIFPAASATFDVGGTVWLGQSPGSAKSNHTYARSITTQIGRITAIENRTFLTADEEEVTCRCLIIDPSTVQPFVVRTGENDASAIAATKELTDAGTYACCFAMFGVAMAGETNMVKGKHDGTVSNNARHPYRIQGTEYMAGHLCIAADVVSIKGDGTAIVVNGETLTPNSSQYIHLLAPRNRARLASGNLSQFLAAGYTPIGVSFRKGPNNTAGYITNMELTPSGVVYPTGAAGGADSSSGTCDYFQPGASPAAFMMGGSIKASITYGTAHAGGLAFLFVYWTLSASDWFVGARA